MRGFKRSFEVFVWIAFILLLSASASQANPYTCYVGSVSWSNHGDVYTGDGNFWSGDDFTGPAGTELTTPPYEWLENPSAIFLRGDSTVSLTHRDPHTSVAIPNYDSSGSWLSVYDADFVVNLQAGPPDPGYAFSILIRTEDGDDKADLSVASTYSDDWTGLTFEDESGFLIFMDLSGYSSIGLRIHVDESGNCTPYYWLNPSDGFLGLDDYESNWESLGTAITQIDLDKKHLIFFSNSTTDLPVPEQPVSIDIKPTSCPNPLNVESKGVLPVAILGSDEFDVTTIDPASIRLEGIAPIRSRVKDVSTPVLDRRDVCDCNTEAGDGFDDLILKFHTQSILVSLGDLNDVDDLVLTLTGKLVDGTLIEGKDCVWILKHRKPH
jgi:hypothetical protein